MSIGKALCFKNELIVSVRRQQKMAMRSREEERQRLINQINEWNANRYDLFALSLPNEVENTIFAQETCESTVMPRTSTRDVHYNFWKEPLYRRER